jgi:hypothetical protein
MGTGFEGQLSDDSMPPDVFLVLASSGLTLVASLLFFVSDDAPPPERDDEARSLVSFCLPPRRRQQPPPLPSRDCEVAVSSGALHGVVTLRPQGEDWVVTLETTQVDDTPEGVGAVHDLRWHGQAGVVRGRTRSWKQKPGRA